MFDIKRRKFLIAAGAALAGARATFAQTSNKVLRLGTLTAGAPFDEKSPNGATLLKTLERNGYVVGKNLTFIARGASGQVNKLGEIIREMKDQVDAFVVTGYPTTLACKVANVPTVVGVGASEHLIDSLARPGGNLTGISDNANTLSTKRLALIRQAVPKLQRVAMMWNRNDLGMSQRCETATIRTPFSWLPTL